MSGHATPSTAEFRSHTTSALDQHESDPAFEGNSSLAAHSAYASKFLESAVSRSAVPMSTPKMGAALSTLKQMVNMQDNQTNSSTREVRFPNQRAMPTSGLRDLVMPPIQIVLPLLRRLKGKLLIVDKILEYQACLYSHRGPSNRSPRLLPVHPSRASH